MEEWWGQLGPCDTALLCTVSRQAGHQPRAHSSGDYHGYYLLFTATPRVDVSSAAAVWSTLLQCGAQSCRTGPHIFFTFLQSAAVMDEDLQRPAQVRHWSVCSGH